MFLICTFEFISVEGSEFSPSQISISYLALIHNIISLVVFSAGIPSFLVLSIIKFINMLSRS